MKASSSIYIAAEEILDTVTEIVGDNFGLLLLLRCRLRVSPAVMGEIMASGRYNVVIPPTGFTGLKHCNGTYGGIPIFVDELQPTYEVTFTCPEIYGAKEMKYVIRGGNIPTPVKIYDPHKRKLRI